MHRIFFGNFDFEHELAASVRANRASEATHSRVSDDNSAPWLRPSTDLDRQFHTALSMAWVAVATADDLVMTTEAVAPPRFRDLAAMGWAVPQFVMLGHQTERIEGAQFVPWGWTPSMRALANEHDWLCDVPPIEIVRHVNSRRFRLELETSFDVALAGAAVVESVEQLESLVTEIADAPLGWILKSNFGMAGRESLRDRGGVLSEALLNWARRRIEQTGCVVFEPVVASLAEAGVQIEIPSSGPPQLIGVTPLLVDRSGTYRGSRFGNDDFDVVPWQPAIDVALKVATHVQQLGYFGPLGIDAMQYRAADGEPRIRPLQDLNARFTMGRLALGFDPIVPSGWCASWLRAPRRAAAFMPRLLAAMQSSARGRARLVTTSPDAAESQHSILILADSAAVRTQLETDYLRACAALARSDSTSP